MDEDKDNQTTLCIDYLHPEILSAEVLISLFNERKIKYTTADSTDKCKLIEIFYNNLLPKCQRVYGDGRRAKRLTKTRNMKGENSKNDLEKICSSFSKIDGLNSREKPERIKPPPQSNCEQKSIKINCNRNSMDTNDSTANSTHKRKIAADSLNPNEESPKRKRHSPIIW